MIEAMRTLDEAASAVPELRRRAYARRVRRAQGESETKYYGKNFRTLCMIRVCHTSSLCERATG